MKKGTRNTARGTGKRRLLATLFFIWLIALLALTYWPDLAEAKAAEEGFRTDYLGHFGFYAALVFFFLLWQRFRGKRISGAFVLQVILAGIALGAATELTQQFVPGRSLNPVDMLFNCLGVLAGAAASAVVGHRA